MNYEKKTITHTVRISESLENELSTASDELEMAKQDIVRLTMKIGLQHLKNVDYNLAKAVLQTSQDNSINLPNSPSSIVITGGKNKNTKVKTKK